MAEVGSELVSPQTAERLIFRSTEESSNGELFQAELIMEPSLYVIRSHIHPNQEESFVVLEGRFGIYIDRVLHIADAGETLVCPPNTAHTQWNAGSGTLRILYEHRPGLKSAETFFETYYGLSRDGKLNKKGDMNLLQGAVLLDEVGDFIRPTFPPWPIIPPMAKLGRRLGFRATYPEYAAPPPTH